MQKEIETIESEALKFSFTEYLKLKLLQIFCCLKNGSNSFERFQLYQQGIKKFRHKFDLSKFMLLMGEIKMIKKLLLIEKQKKIVKKYKYQIIG